MLSLANSQKTTERDRGGVFTNTSTSTNTNTNTFMFMFMSEFVFDEERQEHTYPRAARSENRPPRRGNKAPSRIFLHCLSSIVSTVKSGSLKRQTMTSHRSVKVSTREEASKRQGGREREMKVEHAEEEEEEEGVL